MVPGLATAVNRYLVRAPGMQHASLYRVFVLRDRGEVPATRRAKVSVIVPARNEAGNISAAVARTPVMGTGTELVFVEGHSSDDTWATIQRTMQGYQGPLELKNRILTRSHQHLAPAGAAGQGSSAERWKHPRAQK